MVKDDFSTRTPTASASNGGSGSGSGSSSGDGDARYRDLLNQLEQQRAETQRLNRELQDVQADKVQLESQMRDQFESRVESEVDRKSTRLNSSHT